MPALRTMATPPFTPHPATAAGSGLALSEVQAVLTEPALAHLLSLVRLRMGYPQEAFAMTVLPVLSHCLDQMAPGSSCEQAVVQALHQVLRSLDRRRLRILPPQVEPEALGAQAPGWTYAVVVSALCLSLSEPGQESALACWEASMTPAVRHWLQALDGLLPTLQAVLTGEVELNNPIAQILSEAGVLASASFRRKPLDGLAQPPMPQASTQPSSIQAEALTPLTDWPAGEGGSFYAWVASGLQSGQLKPNHREALVHRVAEGLLLVSPALFRRYLAQCPADPNRSPAPEKDRLRRLQREVLRVGWHLKGAEGVTLHAYAWAQGAQAPVHGLLVTEGLRLVRPLPAINTALSPLTMADPGRSLD